MMKKKILNVTRDGRMNMLENIVGLHRNCTVIEIQHMKFQESAVSKAIQYTFHSLQSTVGSHV